MTLILCVKDNKVRLSKILFQGMTMVMVTLIQQKFKWPLAWVGFMVLILTMGICSVSPGRGGLPGLIGHSVSPPPAIRRHSRAVAYPTFLSGSSGRCHLGVHLLTQRNVKSHPRSLDGWKTIRTLLQQLWSRWEWKVGNVATRRRREYRSIDTLPAWREYQLAS